MLLFLFFLFFFVAATNAIKKAATAGGGGTAAAGFRGGQLGGFGVGGADRVGNGGQFVLEALLRFCFKECFEFAVGCFAGWALAHFAGLGFATVGIFAAGEQFVGADHIDGVEANE